VRGLTLPPAAFEHLARRVTGGVRELEGALNRVTAAAHLSRAPLTAAAVTAVLNGVVDGQSSGVPAAGRGRMRATPQLVLQTVATTFGISPHALVAKRRDREVVLARQVAMFLMREETGASLNEIGATLGGRDHSTVLHGCEKIATALAAEQSIGAPGSDGAAGEHGPTRQTGQLTLTQLVSAARQAVLGAAAGTSRASVHAASAPATD
jgi:chromosomal replication initiator protein